MHSAVETTYRGYRFRSRLEARWAVFFDHLAVEWEYEKEGFELSNGMRYLPDFWIPCPRYYSDESGYWLEIKGPVPSDVEIDKCKCLALDTGHICLLAYGSPTQERFEEYCFDPIRRDGVVVDVRISHTAAQDPHLQELFDAIQYDPNEEPFFAHFGIASRFWFGQKESEFDQKVFESAILAARSARFEYGESGA